MINDVEQNLQNLRLMRNLLTPSNCRDNPQRREKKLGNLKAIRRAISPACTISDEERQQNLAKIRAIIKVRRG